MAKIIIKNVGPIKKAELELNKINVFMGPQSSGKSTIAKLISYCQWVEKRYILDGEYKEKVDKQLLKFHHLDANYFEDNSNFEYESDFVRIKYSGIELTEEIVIKENKILDYKKSKNIYIPAERNFISVIPNLGKYNENNDNIMSLIYDWFSAKKSIPKEQSISVLNFNINYYNNDNSDQDILVLNETNKEISLNTGSSGLQSITPLIVILEYLTKNIYEEKKALSPKEKRHLIDIVDQYIPNFSLGQEQLEKFFDTLSKEEKENFAENIQKMNSVIGYRSKYMMTSFIIEEPEQNLFPEAQRDLVYYILEKLQSEREHSLTMTTHSPYILYALNNCMLGGLVYDKMSDEDKKKVNCQSALINPKKVSIYEIRNGVLTQKDIQQEDGLIGANYFDQNMKALMDDFYVFLKYYDDEE